MLCSAGVAQEIIGKMGTRPLTHSMTNIYGAPSVPGPIPGMEDSAENKADRDYDLMGTAGNNQGSKYIPYFTDSKMSSSRPPFKNL